MRSASRSLVAAALAAVLQSCGSSNQPDALVVNTKSGARVDISGTTWAACQNCPDPTLTTQCPVPDGHSLLEREIVSSRGAVAFTLTEYASPGCVGTVVNQAPKTAAIVQTVADRPVTFVPTTPPGVTPPVTASGVQVDLGTTLALDCYWVDDSVTPRVLYVGASGAQVDQSGFPTQLSSIGLMER